MIERTRLISDIEQEITSLPDQFQEPLEATIVTRDGKKVMAILPYHTYRALLETLESLQETLEIMKDPETMEAIRQGIQEAEQGETVAWEDVKKELEKIDQGNEGAQD
jgi:antitoxin YefM